MMKLYKQKNIALGSEAVLTIVSNRRKTEIDAIFSELWIRTFKFEKRFSRFLPTSELSMFNRSSGSKQIISEEFHDILQAAKRLSIDTGGLYNPFVLPALQKAGYTQSFVKGAENDIHEDHSRKSVVSIDKLEFGSDWARIPYGTAIDLGGCGKGFLADQLADYIQSRVIGYSISLGGDIVCGGLDENGANFSVTIQKVNSYDDEIVGEIIMLIQKYSVASSGITKRRGSNNGSAWHHIIDPKTLEPAKTDILLATVCHASGLYADVLASCCVILGSRKSKSFLRSHGVNDALFQVTDADGGLTTLHMGKMILQGTY
jgi:thiamine biosynthesis lipoprotein